MSVIYYISSGLYITLLITNTKEMGETVYEKQLKKNYFTFSAYECVCISKWHVLRRAFFNQ